jgi:hypothetical protein
MPKSKLSASPSSPRMSSTSARGRLIALHIEDGTDASTLANGLGKPLSPSIALVFELRFRRRANGKAQLK